jgi:DNA-binding transcriptional ArsR family regulator
MLQPLRPNDAASAEWVILDLLLERSKTTWSIGELVDSIGSPSAVAEALEALQTAGLIERSGAFVRIARELKTIKAPCD